MLDRKTKAIAAIPKKTCRMHFFLSKIDIHAAFVWKDEQKSQLKIDLWVVLQKMNIKIHKVLLLPSLFCLKIHWIWRMCNTQKGQPLTNNTWISFLQHGRMLPVSGTPPSFTLPRIITELWRQNWKSQILQLHSKVLRAYVWSPNIVQEFARWFGCLKRQTADSWRKQFY